MSSELWGEDIHEVLASVGNNENKAVLFAAMDADVAYTQTSLHRRHLEIQGDDIQWRMAISAPIGYAHTFAKLGLVAKETVGANNYPAYQRTEKGNGYVPLVGYLLNFSLADNAPLLAYSGPTNTSSGAGIRPNQRRVEVMRLLLDHQGKQLRVSDVAESLNIDTDHAATITDTMGVYGLLEKNRTGRGKPSLSYLGTPELANVVLRQDIGSQMLFDVVNVMQEMYKNDPDASFTNESIARKLMGVPPYTDVPVSQLIRQIAQKTHQLAKNRGVLVTKRGVVDAHTARETIFASEDQLSRLDAYLSIVDGAIANTASYVQAGKQLAEKIVASPDLVGKLIIKAKQESVGLKRTDALRQKALATLRDTLRRTQGPLLVADVNMLLQEQDKIFSPQTVANYLNVLVKLGEVSTEEGKSGRKYVYVEQIK
jgi:Fe2+ or Zn2+ uptake regulation protein